MPINKGGNKHKKKRNKGTTKGRKLEDIGKDFDPTTYEVYGVVTKPLGNRRFEVVCQKLKTPNELESAIICSIKGSFRRKIVRDNYVLVKLYDFNTKQGQIIDSYREDEIVSLKESDLWDFPQDSINIDTSLQNDITDLPSDYSSDEEEEEVLHVPKSVAEVNDILNESQSDVSDIDAI
jgi:translation initiation factor IF-1